MLRKVFCKVVLLGDAGVGKTSLAHRWIYGTFPEKYLKTIGAAFGVRQVEVKDPDLGKLRVMLQIWDIGGDETWDRLRPSYYEGSFAAIAVYDVTRRETFYHIPQWVSTFLQRCPHRPIVLIGNKIDIRDQADNPVSTEEGQRLADELKSRLGIPVLFIETSAKTGENCERAFRFITNCVVAVVKSIGRLSAPK